MNEVSIIINGVRYEAEVVLPNLTYPTCSQCDLNEICGSEDEVLPDVCNEILEPNQVFKKSNKSFEK